jgi:hypothetical protein
VKEDKIAILKKRGGGAYCPLLATLSVLPQMKISMLLDGGSPVFDLLITNI